MIRARVVFRIASALSMAGRGSLTKRILFLNFPDYSPQRTLINQAYYGLNDFVTLRDERVNRLSTARVKRDEYFKMLSEQLADESKVLVLDDLENVLLLANSRNEAQLASSMLQRLESQVKAGVTPRANTIGQLTFRMFRHLQLLDEALACFRNPALSDAFGITATAILLDSLYDAARYEGVFEVYDILKARRKALERNTVGLLPSIIFAATCYRLGTAETLARLRTVIEENKQAGVTFCQHELCLTALLAIKHKQFEFASECEKLYPRARWGWNEYAVRTLRVIEQGAPAEELVSLIETLHREFAGRRQVVGSDLIKRVDEQIIKLKAQSDSSEHAKRLENARNQLASANLLSMLTVEQLIFRWITKLSPREDTHTVATTRSVDRAQPLSASKIIARPTVRSQANYGSTPNQQTRRQGSSPASRHRSHNSFSGNQSRHASDTQSMHESGEYAAPPRTSNYGASSDQTTSYNQSSSPVRTTKRVRAAVECAPDEELVSLFETVRRELESRRASGSEKDAQASKRIHKLVSNLRAEASRAKASAGQLESVLKQLVDSNPPPDADADADSSSGSGSSRPRDRT